MIKAVILYGHPTDPEAFEAYYGTTHMALVPKVKGISKMETTKFLPNQDGSKPEYYRMAELWFETPDIMQAAFGSPEGIATSSDLANFATGGFKISFGIVG